MMAWFNFFGRSEIEPDAAAFDKALQALQKAANLQRGAQPSEPLKKALNQLSGLKGISQDDKVMAAAKMIPWVESPTGAGFVSVWLGSWVEQGGDPRIAIRPIIDAMAQTMGRVKTAPEGSDDADEPLPDPEVAQGLEYFGNALVTHIARLSADERSAILETPGFLPELQRIEHLSNGAVWILHLFRQRSGEVTVLNVPQKKGVVLRYENIATNFHLFTLLQAALAEIMPDSQPVIPEMLACARGEAAHEGQDTAWWHFGQPISPKPELASSIWGEGSPEEIMRVYEEQVLLLWSPIIGSRSWDSGFFGPALDASRAGVDVIRLLSDDEIEEWWQRLKLPH